MRSLYDRIAEARQVLVRAGLPSDQAAIDAEVLARHALGWDRARLLAEGRGDTPDGFHERFAALIERRGRREPVAFITGHREFWGLDFEVTRDVLIPRPETELIIEAACNARPGGTYDRIVDVGTGSGCLAVSLALEFPNAHVLATDISSAALAVATRNAARHGVSQRVTFARADLLESISRPVDLIVSNPPYVPVAAGLSPDVARYEPSVALYSGTDGLSILVRLIASARARLAERGVFVVEFGYGQDAQILERAAAADWRSVTIVEDLQQIPRVAVMEV
jgi:release factor glutamine methyltransferase